MSRVDVAYINGTNALRSALVRLEQMGFQYTPAEIDAAAAAYCAGVEELVQTLKLRVPELQKPTPDRQLDNRYPYLVSSRPPLSARG